MSLGMVRLILTYSDVKTFLTASLEPAYADAMPVINPGPTADQDMQDISPDRLVLVAMQAGLGMDGEELFMRPVVSIRSIGAQGLIDPAYTDAETLAFAIDKALIAVDSSQFINGKWTLSIMHATGTPSLLMHDDAGRFHFLCNYIWEVVY